jgi:hypothetical protein
VSTNPAMKISEVLSNLKLGLGSVVFDYLA